MIFGSAVVSALALTLSAATSPCRWYHSDVKDWDDNIGGPPEVSLSRCMSAIEHVLLTSAKCGIMADYNSHLAQRDGNWTQEDCDSVSLNPHGDRCETHTSDEYGTLCRSAEVNKMVDDSEFPTWRSVFANCSALEGKGACNDDLKCRWVAGRGCWAKLHATEVAFCRQFAEGHCGGSMPPKFSDLDAEEMAIFDDPVEEAEHGGKFEWSKYLDGQYETAQSQDDLGDSGDLSTELEDLKKELENLKKDASAAPRVAVSSIAVFIAAAVLNF